MAIRILPDNVVSQISAGEVVERPTSVVKELLENSIDANARKIIIHVEKAGQRLVEVSDDGDGIPADELALALERHATSKLQTAEDLFSIHTLGFRGEALASIASVSRMTLTSRQKKAEIGARISVEGGMISRVEPIGVPSGTVVRVEDLFYNVPARLKFLKQAATERRKIDDLVTRYALAYPEVAIHLYHDGQPVLQAVGAGDQREVLVALYGVEIARQMLEVSMEEQGFKVSGFTSPVALTRSNRHEITFFVNGRWIQDAALSAALLQAYHTLLMVGRYPLTILFIEIPPENLDVNVHPAKAEVRFRNPEEIFSYAQRAVRRALLAYSPVPRLDASAWNTTPFQKTIDPSWKMAADLKVQPSLPAMPAEVGKVQFSSDHLPILRLVGQIGAAYLVAEGPDGLYLIDQHAAHERVLFEKFQGQLSGEVISQTLLESVTFQLPPQSTQLLVDNLSTLLKIGFDVEAFGANLFRIRSVPAIFINNDPAAAVKAVVEDFEEDETPLQSELEARLVARICKRNAVKAGQVLSVEEQRTLLNDLETCKSPRTCPHGRPTMIHLSVELLERQFGRRGTR